MWARPIIVWCMHAVFASGGLYMVIDDQWYHRATVFAALMLVRICWTRRAMRDAADAKLEAACHLAASRRGLSIR